MSVPLGLRSVGVVERNDELVQQGYTLFCAGRETYLIDNDGRCCHSWKSSRQVFVSYLLPDGCLLRDGSDNEDADQFRAGGAAGFVEVVTWDNKPVWSFCAQPFSIYLSHHDLEPMPNGNVLVLCWTRRKDAVSLGRRPDLMPDGEVWDNLVIELKPDGKGGADIVWRWSFFDYLSHDSSLMLSDTDVDYVKVRHQLFDINFCPPGGKEPGSSIQRCGEAHFRNAGNNSASEPLKEGGLPGLSAYNDTIGKTGEKDWLHANAVSYCPIRNQVLINLNVPCEIVIIDKMAVQVNQRVSMRSSGTGGIKYRWGNPQSYRHGTRTDQKLFVPHYANFIEKGFPGEGHVMVFNNGRSPDRMWTTVDEIELPETKPWSGEYIKEPGRAFGPDGPCWSYGQRLGRARSFFCHHISGAHRLPNGNTLITQGPQGIIFEVTAAGEEVWRYISPMQNSPMTVSATRQGDSRTGGRFSIFFARKYAADHPAFKGASLSPGPHLEA